MFVSLFSGDPLTPGVAAIPNLDPSNKKYTSENSPVLPKIPVLVRLSSLHNGIALSTDACFQAIGYGNAQKILDTLGGPNVPKSWAGGLPITYHLGPSPPIEMHVEMQRSLKSIFNVIGTFNGKNVLLIQDRRQYHSAFIQEVYSLTDE